MICASIPDFKNYIIEHSLFSLVLEFLDKGIDDLGIGRYDLGEGVFAMVSEYQTKDFDEGFIEAHRKYIDIQIILRGAEKIGVADIKTCIPVEYDEEKDFLKLKGEVKFIKLKEGGFAVFFPADAHMPQIKCGDKKELVKKMVIKVPQKLEGIH